MKDKKIIILQMLFIGMIILSILVSIILFFCNTPEKTEIEQANKKNETKENDVAKPLLTVSPVPHYIPDATDEEKIQRGYELFGNTYCSRSEYIVNKLKKDEWNISFYDHIDENHPLDDVVNEYKPGKCQICGKVYNGEGLNVLCDECAQITNRCMICGKLNLEENEYKIPLENLKSKENILVCMQSYIEIAAPEDDGGDLITSSLNITNDYYIYYYKNYNSLDGDVSYYKKIDEKTANNIIKKISKLKDEKLDVKSYKITAANFSISTTGNEISNILKEYGIDIIL